MNAPQAPKKNGRLVLLGLFAIAAIPILAAQAAYQWWRPAGGRTFGQLIAQPAAPQAATWRLVTVGADCGNDWQSLLVASRQLRLAQGQETDRISRATSGRCGDAQLPALPASTHMDKPGLYLVDPHGNAVTYYTSAQLGDVEGQRKVIKEIGSLLKNNKGLG
ncbi:hypothetical protein SAMN02745857_03647 [Andreprevotia lacus DSM 23236]|jgi:hypothetical protein|uniref:Uncharacterized protein n=1 Tax=Andreprevotia lacus DSM 23236 TaxID=1121001 RepID=A0A1W1XYX1_9NEIS|nr:hypothetical protein [Andreprevotia lacus]SMC29170.1 hypothetical protein SAMN02745857_03647 [Andreprevotia lacus DSM 23236]